MDMCNRIVVDKNAPAVMRIEPKRLHPLPIMGKILFGLPGCGRRHYGSEGIIIHEVLPGFKKLFRQQKVKTFAVSNPCQ